jgi:sugar phosphate permease
MLILGYMGIYLCRKNLSVAIPMLETEFGVTRAQLGRIASYSTVAYAAGKFLFGPVVDRLDGRLCFFVSLLLVALFGAAGAFAPALSLLTVWYSANRLAGSAAWGSMMKLLPDWFPPRELPFAVALLSLGFVFGGVCATLFSGQVAHWSGNNWRMVMGAPSVAVVLFVLCSWFVLPSSRRLAPGPALASDLPSRRSGPRWREGLKLVGIGQFWVVCALSFALTLMRETFNTWTVDFFRTEGGAEVSNRLAAFLATPFDAFGALGIVTLGWIFGRIGYSARRRLLFAILLLLTALIWLLPHSFHQALWVPTAAIGLIGFLAYGPYSLLAGVMSVEIRGKEHVGTVSGIVDGVGYLAAILAGQEFGHIVDIGGYRLGFHVLATLTAVSAFLCLLLYRGRNAVGYGSHRDLT